MKKSVLLLLALPAFAVSVALFCCTDSASAVQTIPYKMNFQGRITNTSGTTLPNGTYNMKFRIYDAASSGTLLWSEQRAVSASTGVSVSGGLFSVQLGDATSLPPTLFTSATPIYFEIELPTPATATCSTASCESYTEGPMTPRNKLGASAYSFNSDTLDGLDSSAFGQLGTSNTWTGTNLIKGTNSNMFTVQTGNSDNLLHVDTSALQVQIGSGYTGATLDVTGTNSGSLINARQYGTGNLLNLQAWAGSALDVFKISNTGNVTIKPANNNTGALLVQNSSGGNVLTVDTTNGGMVNLSNVTAGNYSLSKYASIYANSYWDGTNERYMSDGTAYNFLMDGSTDDFFFNTTAPGTAGSLFGAQSTLMKFTGSTGSTIFQNRVDSTAALQVKNATASKTILNVDTQNSEVTVAGTSRVTSTVTSAGPRVVGTGANINQGMTSSASATTSANTQAGDLVVVTGYVEPSGNGTASANYGTLSWTSGMTLAPGFPLSTDDANMTTRTTHRLYVWYYYATAAGPSAVSISSTQTLDDIGISTVTVRGGAVSGNPFAETPSTATISSAASGVTSSPPVSLTLGAPNSLVLWAFGNYTCTTNLTTPAGYSLAAYASAGCVETPSISQSTYSAAGSTGSITIPESTNQGGMSAALLSLRGPGVSYTASLFTADAAGNIVTIGESTTDSNATLLVLDSYNQSSDLSGGVNGAMYYNTSMNQFRCFTNGAWGNCGGGGSYPTLQDAYSAGFGTATGGMIKVSDEISPLTVQDSDMSIGGTLFAVTNSNASGMGSNLFSVASGPTAVSMGSIGTQTGQVYISGTLPVEMNAVSAPATVGIAMRDRYIFSGNNAGGDTQAIDYTNPSSPVTMGTTSVGTAYGIAAVGNYVYTSLVTNSIQTYDVSNPNAIVAKGQVSMSSATSSIVVHGKYLYALSRSGSTISKIDITILPRRP